MSTTKPSRFQSAGTDTRHCKEDALTDREFERLVEASYKLDDDYFSKESRFVIFAAGRLGMRAGEIAHMRRDWIDFRRQMIEVPAHQGCQKGKDGGICGHCRTAAEQIADHNPSVSVEQAKKMMWSPKTEASAREIPLDATTRAALAVEDYFEEYDSFQASQTGVNRRVNRTTEVAAGVDVDRTYPHCLRATSASFWAARGLNAVGLKSLMGWSSFDIAINYIEESGERTSRALQAITE